MVSAFKSKHSMEMVYFDGIIGKYFDEIYRIDCFVKHDLTDYYDEWESIQWWIDRLTWT